MPIRSANQTKTPQFAVEWRTPNVGEQYIPHAHTSPELLTLDEATTATHWVITAHTAT